jgi:hypothetical protein
MKFFQVRDPWCDRFCFLCFVSVVFAKRGLENLKELRRKLVRVFGQNVLGRTEVSPNCNKSKDGRKAMNDYKRNTEADEGLFAMMKIASS